MNLILFDFPVYREQLKPVTNTRPISSIRSGILTLAEKWEKRLGVSSSVLTESYLQKNHKAIYTEDNLYVNASVLPDKDLIDIIQNLNLGEALFQSDVLIACRTEKKLDFAFSLPGDLKKRAFSLPINYIREHTDLFLKNGAQILLDYDLLSSEKPSGENPDQFTKMYNRNNVFIGENVKIRAAIINAEDGPVYIGNHAVIQEGSVIIGPVAIGDHAMVAFGAKIRPNTTIGPYCRVGGEVSNSVFQAYSNKAHEGFSGNSYVGELCNLGANTNNSNLKNNHKPVKLYSYLENDFYDTGIVSCGTIMGDYTKTGISTMLNTGTVIGTCCNVFGAGYQNKFIPDFSWGGNLEGYSAYRFDKAIEVIQATLAGFFRSLSAEDIEILKHISDYAVR